jgi:type II secretory pathway pseudopilin PulG
MLEVLVKEQLAGSFSHGTEVAQPVIIRSNPETHAAVTAAEERHAHRERGAEETVMKKLSAERGMSLVEATIILMVLAILTSVLAPSVGDYVNDARQTKAKEDVEALGTAVIRLLRDTGKPFLLRTVNTTYTAANRVDLLVSEGAIPSQTTNMGVAANSTNGQFFVENAVEWTDAIGTEVELATDHLVTNETGYATVSFPASGGPKPGLGWRGGYLSTSTGPDPWGTRYACTTLWLNPTTDANSAKGTNEDAFCLSAGADANVDTDIESTSGGARIGGDDLIYVMQGNTR